MKALLSNSFRNLHGRIVPNFPRVAFLFGVLLFLSIHSLALPQSQAAGSNQASAQASPAETKLAKKIQSTNDASARLNLGIEFITQHPKSPIRESVAQLVAGKIAEMKDADKQIPLCQNFLVNFKEPGEANLINPILTRAYLKTNRQDEAFKSAAGWLVDAPNEVVLMVQLTLAGREQVKRNNMQNVTQSLRLGEKAVELVEADKKPSTYEANDWNQFKTQNLPKLHQSLGVLAMANKDDQRAKTEFQKAAQLDATDPFNFLLLGGVLDSEYQMTAAKFRGMLQGSEREEMLQKAYGLLDQTIDAYAHTIALIEGNPQYQRAQSEIMQSLESYYRFRHNNSTDGLQALIGKYKTSSKTK